MKERSKSRKDIDNLSKLELLRLLDTSSVVEIANYYGLSRSAVRLAIIENCKKFLIDLKDKTRISFPYSKKAFSVDEMDYGGLKNRVFATKEGVIRKDAPQEFDYTIPKLTKMITEYKRLNL